MRKLLIVLLFFVFGQPAIAASDLDREKRWSEQISDGLLVGDAIELKSGDTPFLGIYAEANNGTGKQATIVVHGMGAHPDWPDVINPLRSELPEYGWSTLSIQMPVLGNDAALKDYLPLFDEASPRLTAAIGYLREQGNETIVIIAHSLGASMAARFVADNPAAGIKGLVIVGMSVTDIDDKMNGAKALAKIKIPVLDIYGSRDLDGVLSSSEERARTAAREAGNSAYRQQMIEGADHFFVGLEDELVRRIYGWLKKNFDTKGAQTQ